MAITVVRSSSYENGEEAYMYEQSCQAAHSVVFPLSGENLNSGGAAPTAYQGSRMMRAWLKADDPVSTATGYRAELGYNDHTSANPDRRGYKGAFYLPTGWDIAETRHSYRIISQWHTGSGSPAYSIHISTDKTTINLVRYDGTSFFTTPLASLAENTWVPWIFEVLWRRDSTGYAKFWINDTLVYNYTGATAGTNATSNASGIFFKNGIYGKPTKVYHDDMEIVSASSAGDDVFSYLYDGAVGPPDAVTIDAMVAFDDDDVQVFSDGSGYSTGGQYNPARASLTVGGTTQAMGQRFRAVGIPHGAVFSTAKVRPYITSLSVDDADLVIRAVKEANPAVWNSTTRRPTDLTLTDASVTWVQDSLGTGYPDYAGLPDVAPILNELTVLEGFDETSAVAWVLMGRDTGSGKDISSANVGAAGGNYFQMTGTYTPAEVVDEFVLVYPTPFTVTWTPATPTVVATANQYLTPSAFTVTWTGATPTVRTPRKVTPSPFTVTWTGATPTIHANQTVYPTPFTVAWVGVGPVVRVRAAGAGLIPGWVELGHYSATVSCTAGVGDSVMEHFQIGTVVWLRGRFKALSGALTDPSSVTCRVQSPSGTETTPVPERESEGSYIVTVRADEHGEWWYRFEGDGAVETSAEMNFTVDPSRFSGAA